MLGIMLAEELQCFQLVSEVILVCKLLESEFGTFVQTLPAILTHIRGQSRSQNLICPGDTSAYRLSFGFIVITMNFDLPDNPLSAAGKWPF